MADLTRALYEYLAKIEHDNRVIDQGKNFDLDEVAAYRQLVSLGFCKEGETGGGGRFIIFSITQQGEAALAAYRANL